MSETVFVSKVLGAFSKIKGEIDEKGGEFDFRYTGYFPNKGRTF